MAPNINTPEEAREWADKFRVSQKGLLNYTKSRHAAKRFVELIDPKALREKLEDDKEKE